MSDIKFISPLYDCTFKMLWKSRECRSWFTKLVKLIANVDLSDYELYDPEYNKSGNIKEYRLDIVFKSKSSDDILNIEMYKDFEMVDRIKSHAYVFRILSTNYESNEEYRLKKAIQINFNDGVFKDDPDVDIISYKLRDKLGKYELDEITIYEVYLHNFRNYCYNESEELYAMLSLLNANSYEEMEVIANGNLEAKIVVDKLKEIANEKRFGVIYDAEKEQRKRERSNYSFGYDEGREEGILEGKAEGILEGKNETLSSVYKVISMLKDNYSIEEISKVTQLDSSEIEKIKEEMEA